MMFSTFVVFSSLYDNDSDSNFFKSAKAPLSTKTQKYLQATVKRCVVHTGEVGSYFCGGDNINKIRQNKSAFLVSSPPW